MLYKNVEEKKETRTRYISILIFIIIIIMAVFYHPKCVIKQSQHGYMCRDPDKQKQIIHFSAFGWALKIENKETMGRSYHTKYGSKLN